jgi:hypothetical protein
MRHAVLKNSFTSELARLGYPMNKGRSRYEGLALKKLGEEPSE